jgi:hypothetical protein
MVSAPEDASDSDCGITTFPRFKKHVRATRPYELLISKIKRLLNYDTGWDGYNAAKPNERAIADACALLPRLTYDVDFDVNAEPDGAINLSLSRGDRKLVFVFAGDGLAQIVTLNGGRWHDDGSFQIRAQFGLTAPEFDNAVAAIR